MPTITPLDLARWFDARLHDCLPDAVPDPFSFQARLYGLTMAVGDGPDVDLDAVVRQSWLGEAGSVYDLIDGPLGALARLFDAAVVVTTGWAAPLPTSPGEVQRPSRHPERRRVRLVVVVDDSGVGSVLRFSDDPDAPITTDEGRGELADALHDLWHGAGPAGPALAECLDTVGSRAGGGRGCARRP